MSAEQKAIKATYLSIFGNAALAILKGVTGVFGNSYALIADAIESTTDIFSSILVLFGLKYANRPADRNHPYGHGRAEPLVTFLVVGFLIISAVVIAYESIQNITTPHKLPKPYTLIVLGAVIIIKEIFYRIIKSKGKETDSTALKADAWHHRSDAITSATAFVGISFALYMGKGYESADDWAALVGSVIIVYNSYRIFRPALGEIMDEHFYDDLVEDVRRVSLQVPGVLDTEKCFIRKSGLRYYVDLHIIVTASISVYDGHEIARQLKKHLIECLPQLANVLVHVEPD